MRKARHDEEDPHVHHHVIFANEGGIEKLEEYELTFPVSLSTVHSWMIRLGCKYDRHRQSYYTDGHERPDVVESRKKYLKQKLKLALRQPL